MPDTCSSSRSRAGRIAVFALLAAAAVAYVVVGIVRGNPWIGIVAAAIVVGYAVLLRLARGRSETVDMLGGEGGDERQAQLMQRALAITAQVMVTVALIGTIATFAGGSRLGLAFSGMAALGGVTFAVSLTWLSRHA